MSRDSQIQKVYRATSAASQKLPSMTVWEIEATMLKVLNSAWFQKRWKSPRHVKKVIVRQMPVHSHCAPAVEQMTKRANAKKVPYSVEFRQGPTNLTLIQTLHLTTHLLRPDWLHDPAFCKEFLEIVGRFMGPEAKKVLTEEFRANRVKHRVYSPEARAAASARMIARQAVPDLLALRDELAGS